MKTSCEKLKLAYHLLVVGSGRDENSEVWPCPAWTSLGRFASKLGFSRAVPAPIVRRVVPVVVGVFFPISVFAFLLIFRTGPFFEFDSAFFPLDESSVHFIGQNRGVTWKWKLPQNPIPSQEKFKFWIALRKWESKMIHFMAKLSNLLCVGAGLDGEFEAGETLWRPEGVRLRSFVCSICCSLK